MCQAVRAPPPPRQSGINSERCHIPGPVLGPVKEEFRDSASTEMQGQGKVKLVESKSGSWQRLMGSGVTHREVRCEEPDFGGFERRR